MSDTSVALLPTADAATSPHTAGTLAGLDIHDQIDLLCANMMQYLDVQNATPPTWRTWHKPGDRQQVLWADGVHENGTVVVTLSPEDHLRATILGQSRAYANRNSSNSRGYSGGRNQPERVAQPNGVLCELAVCRHLGLEFDSRRALWSRAKHDTHRAGSDIERFDIEVRSIKDIRNDPWIKHKDVKPGRWVYVTMPIGVEGYQVHILGCGLAETLWAKATKPRTWNDAKQGAWNPETGDRQFRLTDLSKCPCNRTGEPGYDRHTCERATGGPPSTSR